MIEALRQFLPERSAEDILAERIRLTLGGTEYVLPVLTIEQNEVFRASLSTRLGALMAGFDQLDSMPVILGRLGAATPVILEVLAAYDRDSILPPAEQLRTTCTEVAVSRAFFGVLAAAYPLAAAALDSVLSSPELLGVLLAEMAPKPTPAPPPTAGSSEPSSTPAAPTAGPRKRSGGS